MNTNTMTNTTVARRGSWLALMIGMEALRHAQPAPAQPTPALGAQEERSHEMALLREAAAFHEGLAGDLEKATLHPSPYALRRQAANQHRRWAIAIKLAALNLRNGGAA